MMLNKRKSSEETITPHSRECPKVTDDAAEERNKKRTLARFGGAVVEDLDAIRRHEKSEKQ